MNYHFSEKIRFIFGLLVCLLFIFADRIMTVKDRPEILAPGVKVPFINSSDIDIPDTALLEYQSYIQRTGHHDLKQLKALLYNRLGHNDIRVRMNAVEVLGEVDDPDVLDRLWKIYLHDDEAFIRNSAIAGMLNHGTPEVLEFLTQSISDTDPEVRRQSVEGCMVFADAALQGLIETRFAQETDTLNRIALAALLYKIGDKEKLAYLTDVLLHEPSLEFRIYTAHMLQDSGVKINPEDIKEIFVQETHPEVKIWLAALLAGQGDTSGLDDLKHIVSGDADPVLKSSAAQALNALGEQAYVYPYLLDLLKTGDEAIRERALEDLVDFKDYPLLPVLSRVLKDDPSITVREIAAWVMGERKDIEALPCLEQGLNDKSAFVRTGVIAALYKILSAQELKQGKK